MKSSPEVIRQIIAQSTATITIPDQTGKPRTIVITETEVEKRCDTPIQNLKIIVKHTINDTHIDETIFVGPPFENPGFRQQIKNQVGIGKAKDIVPDEEAGFEALATNEISVTKRLGITLSMEVADDHLKTIFQKGTLLPATKTLTTKTGIDNQEAVNFGICQGERLRFSENFNFGVYCVPCLPPGLAGEVKVFYTFNIDQNEVLAVKAEIQKQNSEIFSLPVEFSLQIKRAKQSETFSQDSMLNREKYLQEDKAYLALETAKGRLRRFIQNVLIRIKRKMFCEELNDEQIQELYKKIVEGEHWRVDNQTSKEKEIFINKYNQLLILLPQLLRESVENQEEKEKKHSHHRKKN